MKSNNQISAVFLLTLLVLKAMITPVLFVNFELNKDNIIKNYCENKNRPKLNCNGKCHLAKQLKALNQEDEKQGTKQFISYLYAFEAMPAQVNFTFIKNPNFRSEKAEFYTPNFSFQESLKRIFHPPQFS